MASSVGPSPRRTSSASTCASPWRPSSTRVASTTTSDLTLKDWRIGYGIGLRLIWNLATVISFDLGLSGEDQIFYMELGTQF